jgi:hypothetical protein
VTAAKLGMKTSGAMALFDRNGIPVFCGGITTGRGHEGPSAGATAILALVSHDRTTTTRTQVYGCPLTNVTVPVSSAVLSVEDCQP